LTEDKKQVFGKTIKKFPTLFGGGHGAKPYHARPFPVSQSLEATKKTEIKRLTYKDIFNIRSDSEWGESTFIQAKKTGDVCILIDVRRLNSQIKRKPIPLPKISDLLRKLSGFKRATEIDRSMGYITYHWIWKRINCGQQYCPGGNTNTQGYQWV
jgi:hypothetical protein